jgi:hypothetical protein
VTDMMWAAFLIGLCAGHIATCVLLLIVGWIFRRDLKRKAEL